MLNYKKIIYKQMGVNFLKNAGIMQIGSVINMIIGLILSIFLARYLGPAVFGIYAIIMAIFDVIKIPFNLGHAQLTMIEISEALEKKDIVRIEEVRLLFIKITIFLITPICLILAFFMKEILSVLNYNPELSNYVSFLLLIFIINQVFQYSTILLQASSNIKNLTTYEVCEQGIKSLLTITFIVIGLQIWGILFAQFICGIIIGIIGLIIPKKMFKSIISKDFYKKLLKVKVKEYLKNSVLISFDRNVGSLYKSLPILLAGMFLTSSDVSFIKMGSSFIDLPLILLGSLPRLMDINFPKVKAHGKENFKNYYIKATLYSGLLGLVCATPFYFLGSFLINLLYGPQYASVSTLLPILIFIPALSGFAIGVGAVLRTLRKMQYAIYLNIFILLSSIYLGIFLIQNYALIGVAIYMLIIWTENRILGGLVTYYLVENSDEF